MDDLGQRFRTFDGVRTPDLWSEIVRRAETGSTDAVSRAGVAWWQPTAGARPLGRPTARWMRVAMAVGAVAVLAVAAAVVLSFYANRPGIVGLPPTASPSVGPPASDQPAPAESTEQPPPSPNEPLNVPASCVRPAGAIGAILGCSSDGTKVLIQNEGLHVIDGEGTETQLPGEFAGFVGSPFSDGATISPDGSRIVFAGTTRDPANCHYGALFAVDADGGPVEVLWTSPQNHVLSYPVFSPDGTKIAFNDGNCDSDQSVWVMNADGSDAHQIGEPPEAGLVHGVAWSPAGDRIALLYDGVESRGSYVFAADGSYVRPAGSVWESSGSLREFCWPGRQCYGAQ
jgi:hypothetical protein